MPANLKEELVFKPDILLPENQLIPTAADQLYNHFMTNQRVVGGEETQFHRFVRLSLLMNFIITLIKNCVFLFLDSNKHSTFMKMTGDVLYRHSDIRYHWNGMLILATSHFIYLHLIIVMVDLNNVQWMEPFKMLSGYLSPAQVNLVDPKLIGSFYKRSKFVLRQVKQQSIFCPLTLIGLPISVIIVEYSFFDAIVFGIPSILIWLSVTWPGPIIHFNYLGLFYLTGYYYKLRLDQLNMKLDKMLQKGKCKNRTIKRYIGQLDKLYADIDNANQFWSSFAWSMLAFAFFGVCIEFYGTLFSHLSTFNKVIYAGIYYFSGMLAAVVFGCGAVIPMTLRHTYQLLNRVYVKKAKEEENAIVKIKLTTAIERVGRYDLGFTCGKLGLLDTKTAVQVFANAMVYSFLVVSITRKFTIKREY